mgnify:CR=1 FL=1
MKSVKNNIIYNIIYQLLILIVPILTIPYISRVLGVDGVGIYSYTYSIVYYFMIISLLGINNYGNRVIAQTRDDKYLMSCNFWSIYFIQFIMSILMIIIYFLYLIIFDIDYKLIAFIQILFIFSAMCDVNWFFFGIEEFKITITRNGFLKLLTLIFVFVFIKNENDLWKYTLIMSLMTFLSQLILWPFILKKVYKPSVIHLSNIKLHFKKCIVLFIPVIAVSLYKIMDKVMLGTIVNVTELGYYEQAEKIISVPGAVITALGTVMLPRITNLVSNKQNKLALNYIEKSIYLMMFLAFPMMFGIIITSSKFIPLFLGENFVKSIPLLNLLSITIIFSSFANVIRTEYLLPNENDNVYIISVIIGAIVNFIINFLLIPKYLGIGACIGTIFAEFIVCYIQSSFVKDKLPIKKYLNKIMSFFFKSVIMALIIYPIKYLNFNNLVIIILQIVIGIIIYFVLNIKYIFSILKIKIFK